MSKKSCTFATNLLHNTQMQVIRNMTVWLMPLLLALFVVAWVADEYNDAQMMRSVLVEMCEEVDDDDAEWEEDDKPLTVEMPACMLVMNANVCLFGMGDGYLCVAAKQSGSLRLGQVHRHAPRNSLADSHNRIPI